MARMNGIAVRGNQTDITAQSRPNVARTKRRSIDAPPLMLTTYNSFVDLKMVDTCAKVHFSFNEHQILIPNKRKISEMLMFVYRATNVEGDEKL